MAVQSQPRVAVLGMGESGRGWGTLVSGAGWPVTIYDPDAGLLHGGESGALYDLERPGRQQWFAQHLSQDVQHGRQ